MVPDSAPTGVIQRWHDQLILQLSPYEVLRESSWTPQRNGITWRVVFPDDRRARVHVTDGALPLDEDGFEVLVGQLG